MSSSRPPSSASGRTTRGRLPASVYWRRRVFVLTLSGSLVFVIASLLTGGGDGKAGDGPVAQQAGARLQSSKSATPGAPAATATAKTSRNGAKATVPPPAPTPTLAAPQGVCDPADVVVTPAVAKGAVAGSDVPIGLSLQTVESEACTWQVTPTSLTVKIADGGEEIWTTRHCRKLVPKQSVVLRRAVATPVALTWNARESEEGCRRADWVLAGDYSIAAAALGGEPRTATFVLGAPARETITVTPKPQPTKKPKKPRN